MTLALALFLLAQEPVHFGTEILPVLQERCVSCHGPTKQKAGLRLDTRAAALAGSAFGGRAVIVPGSSVESELFRRLDPVAQGGDEDDRMPAKGEPLDAATIELFRRWIDGGAGWPDEVAGADDGVLARHWAYVAPVEPELPALPPELEAWARTPLDRPVAAKLVESGLAPSPPASPETLIRRASLDLTGLPPSVEEVEAFVADERSDAWERLVERLLASPQYAEHQARRWLDLARYADTQGYEKDERRTMWRYRDWVIEAFDGDMPFDRFTIEQLAGDLLPDAGTSQLLATGFHRNTMVNREGGTDPEEFRVAAVVDRVDTTAGVWLGTTLACARCHDHKFDPFRQREYYELLAFFNDTEDTGNSDEPTLEAPTPRIAAERERLLAALDEVEAVLATWTPELEDELAGWLERQAAERPDWTPLRPSSTRADEGSRLAVLDDGSVLAFGELPATDVYRVELPLEAGTAFTGLRLEVLTDPSLPDQGPGRPSHQNFVLNELVLETVDGAGRASEVPLRAAFADHEQKGYPAAGIVDGNPETGWAIAGGTGASHQVVLPFAGPLAVAPEAQGTRLRARLDQHYGSGHLIGRLRLSVTASPLPDELAAVPPALEERLASGAEAAGDEEVRAWYLAKTPSLAAERERLAALRAELPAVPTALVMRELPEPRTTRVLERGSFLSPGEEVQPGVPAVLPPLAPVEGRPDRLDLARWLVSSGNPLTARVFVNRLWGRLFGRGLVATEDDFGTQGDAPSNPALLDWLALEFARTWSVKDLHRTILASATYRQASVVTPRHLELDPANVLLARAPRLRVEAEVVRDAALAASGLLARTVGGPSVFPPQPEGTWAMTYSSDSWRTSEGPDRWRRGLYTFWRRTAPYPTFQLFDAPSRELVCTRRPRTNTPLQALATLNDPAFVECAAALAHRMLELEGADDGARIEHGFLRCVARRPTETERARVLELVAGERARFTADPEGAAALALAGGAACPGEARPGGTCDPVEVAAWTLVANVLLNLDETLTRG